MGFSYPSDQKRIWTALQIRDRTQLLQDRKRSKLYELMQNLEDFDLKNSSGLVDDVIDLLDSFDAIEVRIANLLAKSNPRDVKTRDSYLEGSVTYEGSSTIGSLNKQRREIIEKIRALIDECGCFSIHWGSVEVLPS